MAVICKAYHYHSPQSKALSASLSLHLILYLSWFPPLPHPPPPYQQIMANRQQHTQRCHTHTRKHDSRNTLFFVLFKSFLQQVQSVLSYPKQYSPIPSKLTACIPHTSNTHHSISPGFWAFGSVCSLGLAWFGLLACCFGSESFLCSFCCVGQVYMWQVHTVILSI